MYCAWRIPAHLRCTPCSILLHLMDICFMTCICLWQISQIQSCLFKVVGPGLVSTSPAFCEQQRQPSSGSACPVCPKNGKSIPHRGGGKIRHNLDSCVSSTTCRLCRFELVTYILRYRSQFALFKLKLVRWVWG